MQNIMQPLCKCSYWQKGLEQSVSERIHCTDRRRPKYSTSHFFTFQEHRLNMLNLAKCQHTQTRVTPIRQNLMNASVDVCRCNVNWPLKCVRVGPLNIFRVGGTEHEGLPIFFWRHPWRSHQPTHIRLEAHVQHSVCFIQNQIPQLTQANLTEKSKTSQIIYSIIYEIL